MADTKLDFMFKIVSDEDFIIFIEVVRLIYITNFSKISDFSPKWSKMKDSKINFSGYFDQIKFTGYFDWIICTEYFRQFFSLVFRPDDFTGNFDHSHSNYGYIFIFVIISFDL